MGPDPSEDMPVAPQGGYLAKRCPEEVQLDILRPVEPLPRSEFMGMLAAGGITYEREVFDTLGAAVEGVVEIDRAIDRGDREQLTADAMRNGTPLVIGGRLPVDATGHRVGEPDLLVRVGDRPKERGLWAYVAVDVKHHIVRDGDDDDLPTMSEALLSAPWAETDGAGTSASTRTRYGDLVQLAHYQRMLEACGHQAEEGRWGGIIGTDQRLAWYDLDSERWDWSQYLDEPMDRRLSTMESYDGAFAHGLVIIEAAVRHRRDPDVALAAEPVAIPDCPECGWRVWCFPILEAAADLSLLPGINLRKRRQHRDRGVTDLHDLAALDDRTARLLTGRVDMDDLAERVRGVDGQTPIAEIIPRRRRQVSDLAGEGVRVVDDLRALPAQTLGYTDAAMNDLPLQIDRARARLGPESAYRLRGVDELVVPRGDIEVDIDMEGVEDGTYLWGALLTERDGDNVASVAYLPFVSWDPSVATGELDAFAVFWEWLRDQQVAATRAGKTLRAYCYNKGAEGTHIRRLGALLGLEDEVEEFLASEDLIDLLEVVRRQLVTGTRMGLKAMAKLAGFAWRGEEGGGALAMVRYVEAVGDPDTEVRAAARRWILEYNEDDVRATAALRDWLDGAAKLLPSVADIKP
ncbi:MAG TPA: TM0106 family RecB-like putative nuclease [Acidimicrobiales bacterium]|nr:TM0106 family RecB-like putative nuclease [Acidimicrobiales bacterium]